jgi:hypothetical protein
MPCNDRQFGDDQVHRTRGSDGQRAFFTIFETPLAVCCIATMTRLAPVTAGDCPVGQAPSLIDLEAAKDGEIEMAAE